MLRSVAVLALPGLAPFEFGVVCEVFGIDRGADGGPALDFRIVTPDPGPVRSALGFDVVVLDDLTAAEDADLIAVPAHGGGPADDRVLGLLRRAHERGAWILSVCSGAFTLAQAGLLDGRRATTHWMHAEELARRFPAVTVDADVLYVQEGRLVTSAGTAAGIDAALHVVREELGPQAASVVARRMVVPPQRHGGQAQYLRTPIPVAHADSFAAVMEWMLEHLDQELTIEALSRRALMSPRTFARRFRADLGTTPLAWLTRQRLLRAQLLVEESDLTLEAVAARVGFGTAAVMRHHFTRVLQTTPAAYRRTFAA
ncbi:transcriptional regulator GlxA family with amidase domain [Rathayibacter tanaceti]|uniref:Helix-turn-helix domain-containing protein n=4 Tax=Rathayibacter tanaceti TaxID=1671680 RepID=A0AAE6V6B7_9MICO|nr:helix-turn-helix domain-containing protein [Rathayibacter tanaceti]QHC56002.1 helix-turn-helix domain-containing protein [Rathayibacter tanaceti]TCO39153.1 transcriptional regulator GlxA family with amidase domain [Rathayibacter tanaceti]